MADISLDYDDFLIMIEKMLNDELGNEDSPLHLYKDPEGKAHLVLQGDTIIKQEIADKDYRLYIDGTGLMFSNNRIAIISAYDKRCDIEVPLKVLGNIEIGDVGANATIRNPNNNTNGAAHFAAGSTTCTAVGEMDFYSTGGKASGNNSRIRLLAPSNLEPNGTSAWHNVILPSSGGTIALKSDIPALTLDNLPSTLVSHYLYVEEAGALAKGFVAQPSGSTRVYRFSAAGCSACFGFSSAGMMVLCKTSSTVGDGVFVSNGTRKLAHVRLTSSGGKVSYSMDYATTTNVTGTIE